MIPAPLHLVTCIYSQYASTKPNLQSSQSFITFRSSIANHVNTYNFLPDMDLFEELESMAVNAADDCDGEFQPSKEEITRWQTVFSYSYSEAIEQIKNQKSDYSRYRVSNDHWDLVKSQKVAQGYSREAYEQSIKTGGQSAPSHGEQKPIDTSVSRAESSYLILLEGILSTPKSIQDAASLSEPPQAVQAASETGDGIFCRIDGNMKQSIIDWLSQQKSTFRPTFVRLSKAKKDLAPTSIYPTLGLESTLPQHRSSSYLNSDTTLPPHRGSSSHTTFSPLQDEYPVWYFFYGTLADNVLLTRLLSLPEAEPPILVPASISGGLIKTWHGKYKALVDGADTDSVYGSAYEVTSKEREEALLLYETEKYEFVRCCIIMASRTVQGLTFRFAGSL